ncbi:MAG: undecaprenyl-diphosphate phosphatase [bacterium]|nr:undecaprenyl-diphosphate phosphatase [bacterium]
MTLFQAVVLGLVQGISEFLPISSSGHLVLGEALLGVPAGDLTFEVFVHFGTLLAVLTALRGRVWVLVQGCFRREAAAWRMVLLLGLGTVPAGMIGILFEDALEVMFSSPAAASGWLLVTGVVLWSTRFRQGSREEVGLKDTILIGLAQAFAILPGISRSGMTISMGLWRGLDGREAATFSFLLSIPVILGATVLKVGELVVHPPAQEALVALGAGTVAAYISGILAIRWLLALLQGGRLDRFAYYCWAVGVLGLGMFWL